MTLASHANAALRAETALRLPAHPAFMVVRRARFLDGAGAADVGAWFARVRAADAAVCLADAGVGGPARLIAGAGGWSFDERDGTVVVSADDGAAAVTASGLDEATEALRDATGTARGLAGDEAPPLWSAAADRAIAILDSGGSGEEVSDVAWPHFILPAQDPMPARRLAAAAATLWLWDGPGAWIGGVADRAHASLHGAVARALSAAVAGA